MNDSDYDRSNRRVVRKVSVESDDTDSEPSQSRCDMFPITCFNCRKTGHYKSQCKEAKRDARDGGDRQRNGANRKHRFSDSERRDRSSDSRRKTSDRQTTDETRDETITRLRAELDRLATSDCSSRSRHTSESLINSH